MHLNFFNNLYARRVDIATICTFYTFITLSADGTTCKLVLMYFNAKSSNQTNVIFILVKVKIHNF